MPCKGWPCCWSETFFRGYLLGPSRPQPNDPHLRFAPPQSGVVSFRCAYHVCFSSNNEHGGPDPFGNHQMTVVQTLFQGIVGCTPIPTCPYEKSLYKPYSSWVFMGYNPQESLENTINTMGIRGTPNCPLTVFPTKNIISFPPKTSNIGLLS